jgi:hypothetical protein
VPDLDMVNVGQYFSHAFRPHSWDPRAALRLYRQVEQLIRETRPGPAYWGNGC